MDDFIQISKYDTPFEIACQLIQSKTEYTNCLNQKTEDRTFSLDELRCLGEHPVNYCNAEEKLKGGAL